MPCPTNKRRCLPLIVALVFLAAALAPGSLVAAASANPISAARPDSVVSETSAAPGSPSYGNAGSVYLPLVLARSETADPLEVHFIDVGQGDAILIVTPDGATALIDGGESGSGAAAYLQSQGITKLDLVVATHPHSDHIGGLIEVLQSIPVSQVVTNGQPHTTQVYERFLDAILEAKAGYVEVKRGDTLALGRLQFEVLNPQDNTGSDLNNGSLVLRLVYGQTSFLFTGDAEQEAEADILAGLLPVQAAVLKVGHHGSSTSSSPAFLAAVRPEIAVYCAGVDNRYGHPHAQTLEALRNAGAVVYGTDKDGTVMVTSDGSRYSVATSNLNGQNNQLESQFMEMR